MKISTDTSFLEKSPKNPTNINTLVKEVLYNSLAQIALKAYHTPHHFLRLFLLACVVISVGFAGYMVVKSLMLYMSYDIITTTRFIFETSPLFPKVTICNKCPFTTKFAFEFLKEVNSSYNFLREPSLLDEKTYQNKFELVENFTMDAISLISRDDFPKDTRRKLSHDLNGTLISCWYGWEECSSSDFVLSYDPYYGNCHVFNSGMDTNGDRIPLKTSNLSGAYYGFQVLIW